MRRNLPIDPYAITYYGGMKPAGTIGAGEFKGHNAAATWDDGGRADQLIGQITDALEGFRSYGAEQARNAVLDYVSECYADMALIEGQASIVIDASNDEAQFRAYWRLGDLLNKVVQDALDSGAHDLIEEVHGVCSRMALMLDTMGQEVEPDPAPVREPAVKRQTVMGRKAVTGAPTPKSRNGGVPAVRRTPRG